MALHIGIGNFGGAIASNVYRTQDSPRYIIGRTSFRSNSPIPCIHEWRLSYRLPSVITSLGRFEIPPLDGIMLMFVGIGFIIVPIVVLLYSRINAQRARIMQASPEEAEDGGWRAKYTAKELREMGDRAVDFRYMI